MSMVISVGPVASAIPIWAVTLCASRVSWLVALGLPGVMLLISRSLPERLVIVISSNVVLVRIAPSVPEMVESGAVFPSR